MSNIVTISLTEIITNISLITNLVNAPTSKQNVTVLQYSFIYISIKTFHDSKVCK